MLLLYPPQLSPTFMVLHAVCADPSKAEQSDDDNSEQVPEAAATPVPADASYSLHDSTPEADVSAPTAAGPASPDNSHHDGLCKIPCIDLGASPRSPSAAKASMPAHKICSRIGNSIFQPHATRLSPTVATSTTTRSTGCDLSMLQQWTAAETHVLSRPWH